MCTACYAYVVYARVMCTCVLYITSLASPWVHYSRLLVHAPLLSKSELMECLLRRLQMDDSPLQASVFLVAISGNKIQHSTYLTRLVDFFLLQTINHLLSTYNMKNQYFCRLRVIRINSVVHYSSTYKSPLSPHSLWPRSAVTSWSHWPAGELQPGQSEPLSASLPAHPPRELLTGRWNALRGLLRAGDLGPASPAVQSSWVPFLSFGKRPLASLK